MGQYYIAVNPKKREYVCPWCLGGVAKLWEWAVNPQAAIFPALLAKTDEGGGGDPDWGDSKVQEVFGRWAGDPVYLVGDYDSSKLFDKARKEYANISEEVGEVVSDFVGGEHDKWDVQVCSSCGKKRKEMAA
ncbi:MAG: hypothetical protein ACE5JI_21310 [Acidobacteriota bacterium]